MTYVLAIIGGRGFSDWDAFLVLIKDFIKVHGQPLSVVSGGAQGADTLGARWAKVEGLPISTLLPDWKRYGKGAANLRNTDIIMAADKVLALPTPVSTGTLDAIRKAHKLDKEVVVIEVPVTEVEQMEPPTKKLKAAPNCNCGKVAIERVVKKDGPTQGKAFFGCETINKADGGCGYFEWKDAYLKATAGIASINQFFHKPKAIPK
jgi:hypothetical protein